MDYTRVGIKEGLIKALEVTKYIVVSMAIVGLTMWISDQSVAFEQVRIAMLVAGANIILAFLQKWLTTHSIDTKK